MTLKLNISDPENGRTVQHEVDNDDVLHGKTIGDTVDGDKLGFSGYTFTITGGSDKAGFPMRKGVSGTGRKKILTSPGVGFQSNKDGIKVRKTVAGETIYEDTVQVNVRIEEHGDAPIDDLHPEEETEQKPAEDEIEEQDEKEESDQTEPDTEEDGEAPANETDEKPVEEAEEPSEETGKSTEEQTGDDTEETSESTEEASTKEEPASDDTESSEDTDESTEGTEQKSEDESTPDEVPDSSWTVSEIKDWLDEHDIDYTSDDLKDDLLDKAQNT